MLYITGPNDTLASLMAQEGLEGNFSEYRKLLAEFNPELFSKLPKDVQKLPPFTPLYLVTLPRYDDKHSAEVARTVSTYSTQERQALREMQETNHDIPTSVASMGLLGEFQAYLAGKKKQLNESVFKTPAYAFNQTLSQKIFFKMTGESMKHGAEIAETSPNIMDKEKLYALMKKRDELNHQWIKASGNTKSDLAIRRNLDKQIKDLTGQIKKLIPKGIAASADKYIHGMKVKEAAQLRSNSSSLKLAGKGAPKIQATHLDRLTTMGLKFQRNMITGFKQLGTGLKSVATYSSYGLATINIVDSFIEGKNYVRTAFQEGAAIYGSRLITAAMGGGLATLGGIAISTWAGDAMLGSIILICYPIIGWVVLVVAGAIVATAISYQVKDIAGRLWDSFDTQYVRQKGLEFGKWVFKEFQFLGEELIKNAP